MNMKKVIAAALMIGTLTTAGTALAMPHDGLHFHDRHGSSHALRWEHHQMERQHIRAIQRHKEAVHRHIHHKIMRDRARGMW